MRVLAYVTLALVLGGLFFALGIAYAHDKDVPLIVGIAYSAAIWTVSCALAGALAWAIRVIAGRGAA